MFPLDYHTKRIPQLVALEWSVFRHSLEETLTLQFVTNTMIFPPKLDFNRYNSRVVVNVLKLIVIMCCIFPLLSYPYTPCSYLSIVTGIFIDVYVYVCKLTIGLS